MSRQLTLQDPGEGIHEAEIVDILVSVGDHVDDGDTVLTVETDKATSEVVSPYSGEVTSIDVEVGQTVSVGDLLMEFSNGDGDGEERKEPERAEARDEREEPEQAEAREEGKEPEQAEAREDGEEPEDADAREEGKEPEQDEAREERQQPARRREPEGEERERKEAAGPVPASPATRRRARELGVDLDEVEPTGPHGRVTTEDVERAERGAEPERAAKRDEPAEEREPAAPEPPGEEADRWGPVERRPLRGVRKAVARQMSASWGPIARVTHHDLADVTEVERMRRRHAERIEEMDGDLTLLVVMMKAVAATLRAFPLFNASLDEDAEEIVVKQYVHLGIAVDTDDGLLVPVVRDVDRKSMTDLSIELPELLRRTRDRELERSEMQGASFTITNVGPLGGTAFTPMVNHPQVAILGMAQARVEPRVVQGDIDDDPGDIVVEPRYVLPLSLSFDHRVVDGADAARFVTALVQSLADPERLLLSL